MSRWLDRLAEITGTTDSKLEDFAVLSAPTPRTHGRANPPTHTGTALPKPTKVPFGSFVSTSPKCVRKIDFLDSLGHGTAKTDKNPDDGQRDPLKQRALDLLLDVPGRRLAVVSDPDPLPDGRVRLGYARRTDDGLIVSAIMAARIDPLSDPPALVEKHRGGPR
jgi:hypothetical protein